MTPAARPRLLFLSQVLPFPPDRGVTIRTHHLVRILSARFDVDLLCFYRRAAHEHRTVADCLESVPGVTTASAHPIPQEHSRSRFVRDHLRSLLTRRPYTRYLYDSEPFTGELERWLARESYALVHVDTLDLSRFVPLVEGPPVVCGHHNIEADLLRRRSRFQANPLKAAYMRLQSTLQEEELRRWAPRAALNLMVSEPDRRRLLELSPGARSAVIPNGVDVERFRPSGQPPERDIVFVGGTEWEPNRDALEHFCLDVLPRIRDRMDDVSVTWVGRSRSRDRRRFSEEHGVELTGYVEDIRPYVRGAACYVVPLRMGGGTRLKILDAWAMGKAVVSTSVGCEGLDAENGENILVRDDPAAFADAVVEVLEDEALRRRVGRRARATAEERYSWESIGRKLLDAYEELLA